VASKATFKAAIVAQGLAQFGAGERLEITEGLQDSFEPLQAEAALELGGKQTEHGKAMVAEPAHQLMGRSLGKEGVGEANGGQIAVGRRRRQLEVEQVGVEVVKLGEAEVAGEDLVEGAVMEQARHVVQQGEIALGGEKAMPLDGTAQRTLQRDTVEFGFDDKVLGALTDQSKTDQFVARSDQEHNGDAVGGAAELEEGRHGGVVDGRGVIEEEDVEGGAPQLGDGFIDVERIRALPASAQTARKACFVHLGKSFFEQQNPVGIVAGDENSVGSFSHGALALVS